MPKSRAENVINRRRRSRWTAREAKKVLQAQAESGLPLSAFAAREGLNPHRLYRWRARLGAIAPMPPAFEEVRGVETALQRTEPAPPAQERLEIVLCSGVVVRVAESFNAEALLRLLDVVDGRRTC
jgi:hypothetical protein